MREKSKEPDLNKAAKRGKVIGTLGKIIGGGLLAIMAVIAGKNQLDNFINNDEDDGEA